MKVSTFCFLLLIFLSGVARATTFKKFIGTYKIANCDNQSTKPSNMNEEVCYSLVLLIEPQNFLTNFYFIGLNNEVLRNIDYLPERGLQTVNAKYEEFEDEAKYGIELKDYAMFTRLKKIHGDEYHLSLYSRFKSSEDLFEIDLVKVSSDLELPNSK